MSKTMELNDVAVNCCEKLIILYTAKWAAIIAVIFIEIGRWLRIKSSVTRLGDILDFGQLDYFLYFWAKEAA